MQTLFIFSFCLLMAVGFSLPSSAASNDALTTAKQLYRNGDEKAFSALYPLAMTGDSAAQFYLAELYFSADFWSNRDEVIKWYQKSADAGNAYAQYNLANLYYDGVLLAVDFGAAAYWYQKAARSGIPQAQLNLGYMYSSGIGVLKNDQLATLWYKAAANFGNPKAQSNLGYRHCAGIGTDKDFNQCTFWLKKAIQQGDQNAHKVWQFFKLDEHALLDNTPKH